MHFAADVGLVVVVETLMKTVDFSKTLKGIWSPRRHPRMTVSVSTLNLSHQFH
jgi:hypothetical protein